MRVMVSLYTILFLPILYGEQLINKPGAGEGLAFTQYCDYQYSVVYSSQTRVRRGSRILPDNRAIVLRQGWQCRWAAGVERMVDSCTIASQ